MRPLAPSLLAVLLPAGLLAAQPGPPGIAVDRQVGAMGTGLRVQVWAVDRATALAASELALRAVEAVEARLSTWRESSELSRFHAAPHGSAVELSAELAAWLERAVRWSKATGGAFDPTLGALVETWGLRRGGRATVPGADELRRARAATGLALLELDGRCATRLAAGLRIEEGGFGKGAALDAALAALASRAGVHAVLLDLGGQLAWSLGTHRLEVAIAHPERRDEVVCRLEVGGSGSLATSGNSERAIAAGGRRRGHLLDPRSGEPAPIGPAITVLAARAFDADCLSTGLYVLGPAAALAFAAELADDTDIDTDVDTALHVDIAVDIAVAVAVASVQEGQVLVQASPGLLADLHAADPKVRIVAGPRRPPGRAPDRAANH